MKGLDGWLISGDISTGTKLYRDLSAISALKVPTHYILGNHDYYWNSIERTRKRTEYFPPHMNYLTTSQPVELTNSTALIGDDGWYDARANIPLTNLVFSIDWLMIGDFWNEPTYREKLAFSRELAWDSTQRLMKKLRQCIDEYERVIIVTHFPPWRQPHRFSLQDRFWTPYNTNHYLGEAIELVSKESPKTKITVLSGHTHIEKMLKITDQIECHIGTSRKMVEIEI